MFTCSHIRSKQKTNNLSVLLRQSRWTNEAECVYSPSASTPSEALNTYMLAHIVMYACKLAYIVRSMHVYARIYVYSTRVYAYIVRNMHVYACIYAYSMHVYAYVVRNMHVSACIYAYSARVYAYMVRNMHVYACIYAYSMRVYAYVVRITT
jgi:hypothetical protein